MQCWGSFFSIEVLMLVFSSKHLWLFLVMDAIPMLGAAPPEHNAAALLPPSVWSFIHLLVLSTHQGYHLDIWSQFPIFQDAMTSHPKIFCFPRISFPPRSIPGPCISDPSSLCWCFDNVQAMSLQHFSSLSAPLCHNKERKWGRCRMLTGPLKDLRWEKHRSQNTLNGALFMWAKNRKMITCLPDL